MRVQVAIADQDMRYLDTLVGFFEQNYTETMEVVAFSKRDTLNRYLQGNPKDVVLLDEKFGLSASELVRAGYASAAAYLVDEHVPGIEDAPHIEKYKRADSIYQDIMGLYTEQGGAVPQYRGQGAGGKLLIFTAFSGGTGVSTIAASFAKYLSRQGEEVLHLNLEQTGASTIFFQGQGGYSFSDLLPVIKDTGSDLSAALQSMLRRDQDGVLFLSEPPRVLDMAELTMADATRLLDTAHQDGRYRYVVVDMNFRLSNEMFAIMGMADTVVVVNDGSMTANEKYARTMETILELERQAHRDLRSHMLMLYNNFSSSKSSNDIPNPYIPVFGKFPPIKHATSVDIMYYLVGNRKDIFEKLRG